MTAMLDSTSTFGGQPVVGQPVSVPSFGAREDVFVAALDALFEAGAKAVAWQPTLNWSIFVTDEEVAGLRSWDLNADDGLDVDAVRRNYGETSALLDAAEGFANAVTSPFFAPVLLAAFGTDSRVICTPTGFEVEPLDTDV